MSCYCLIMCNLNFLNRLSHMLYIIKTVIFFIILNNFSKNKVAKSMCKRFNFMYKDTFIDINYRFLS